MLDREDFHYMKKNFSSYYKGQKQTEQIIKLRFCTMFKIIKQRKI